MRLTRINLDCRDCDYRFILKGDHPEDMSRSHTYEKLKFCPSCKGANIRVMEVDDIFRQSHGEDCFD